MMIRKLNDLNDVMCTSMPRDEKVRVQPTSLRLKPYMAHQDVCGDMISVDGATIVGGADGIGAVGIYEVKVVGDDDLDGEDGHDATLLLHLATIAS
ncbi:hypothetical protein Tco_1540975 [Tanacetum coccineum]